MNVVGTLGTAVNEAYFALFSMEARVTGMTPAVKTSSPKDNDRSPESNVPTSSHFKQASK